MTFLRSIFIAEASHSTKNDVKFINRKRRKDKAKDYVYGKVHAKNILITCISRFQSISGVSENERVCCKDILSKSCHYKHERLENNHDGFRKRKDKQKNPNQRMNTTGAFISPLLLGNVPFSSLRTSHLPLLREELEIRNIHDLPPVKNQRIKAMVKLLRVNEHGEEYINNDKEETKYFIPKFLSAVDWEEEFIDTVVRNYNLI